MLCIFGKHLTICFPFVSTIIFQFKTLILVTLENFLILSCPYSLWGVKGQWVDSTVVRNELIQSAPIMPLLIGARNLSHDHLLAKHLIILKGLFWKQIFVSQQVSLFRTSSETPSLYLGPRPDYFRLKHDNNMELPVPRRCIPATQKLTPTVADILMPGRQFVGTM